MIRKINLWAMSLLGAASAYAQSTPRARSVSQGMNAVNNDVINTITMIRYWVYGLISLFIVIKIIQILVGSDRGDEKMLKAGALFGVLVIGAIIIYVGESVYGN